MNKAIGGDLAPVILTCETRSFVGGVEVTAGRQARPVLLQGKVLLGIPSADKGEALENNQSGLNILPQCEKFWKFFLHFKGFESSTSAFV